ncbi:hypothetical protein F8388_012672 [Cannabis sativa]|uniref:Zinc knuckle CX2CX4HX4C domain-containing protein n=1 Tax=Cannabis sativa TaxID=3483 RepID=A0A7J6HA90_CANSA|nr:hypothetical protein F8388_012672 [Cannabis sativa]
MDPTGINGIFEDTIQLSSEDIIFSLNPGEVDEPQESNKVLLGKIISRQKLKDLWLQYRYEKLPKLCFKCGILTHDQSTCFKPPTVVKDTVGNYYPLYGTWLKNDAQEKSTFSSPLPKWFQDWVLQKQLGKDPVLCNQFKIQKAIRNGESNEMRESRLQLPSKRRIVSDDDREDQDGREPAQVITQLPLVYLPGIGEIAPYGNKNKRVVIQDLIDAAQPSNSTKDIMQGNTTGCKTQQTQTNGSKIRNAQTNITSSGGTTSYAGKETLQTTPQVDQPTSEKELNNTTTDMKSQSSSSKDKKQRDSEYFNPSYSASPLGSQTQFISWPSNECWAQPKARELLMGSLTVDKFHREPTLFNPLLSIDDFRVDEHLKGPRKRKASDGFLFSPSSKSTTQTYRDCVKEEATSNRISCKNLIPEDHSPAIEEQPPPTPAPFVTGHDIDGDTPKRRGRPRKKVSGSTSSGQSLKKRGRPPKNHQGLAAKAK